jgi:hypothetical protein
VEGVCARGYVAGVEVGANVYVDEVRGHVGGEGIDLVIWRISGDIG